MTKASNLLISSQEQIIIFNAFLWEENAPLSDLRREMLELAEFGISEDSDDDSSSEKWVFWWTINFLYCVIDNFYTELQCIAPWNGICPSFFLNV